MRWCLTAGDRPGIPGCENSRWIFEEGEKVPVRIEWIPDGGESYLAVECLTPYDPEEQKDLSLYSKAGKAIDYYFINGNNLG